MHHFSALAQATDLCRTRNDHRKREQSTTKQIDGQVNSYNERRRQHEATASRDPCAEFADVTRSEANGGGGTAER